MQVFKNVRLDSYLLVCVRACVSTREELTYEMLILEPRTSDDETPESEASIGTADSTENICAPGASAESSGKCLCL